MSFVSIAPICGIIRAPSTQQVLPFEGAHSDPGSRSLDRLVRQSSNEFCAMTFLGRGKMRIIFPLSVLCAGTVLITLAGSPSPARADPNANYVNQVYLDLVHATPDNTTLNT